MPFSGPLEDRLFIREFYGSFARASSLEQLQEWLAHWAEDCIWNTQHFSLSGREAVREQWHQLWANFDRVALMHEVCSIEVDGDDASCSCIAREIIQLSGGGIYKLVGCYDDKLVRRNGCWLFARRDYQLLVEEPPTGAG